MPTFPRLLYHLADVENLPSMRRRGLMSTARLVAESTLSADAQARFLRSFRPEPVVLAPHLIVRDHRPMPPKALASALKGGLTPEDWYAWLNGFVFFWTELDRLERQRSACGDRPQVILTFDGDALVQAFGDHARVSPINSGNARRKPSPRDQATLMPYRLWADRGWPSGQRWRRPVEVLFDAVIPLRPPFLIGTAP